MLACSFQACLFARMERWYCERIDNPEAAIVAISPTGKAPNAHHIDWAFTARCPSWLFPKSVNNATMAPPFIRVRFLKRVSSFLTWFSIRSLTSSDRASCSSLARARDFLCRHQYAFASRSLFGRSDGQRAMMTVGRRLSKSAAHLATSDSGGDTLRHGLQLADAPRPLLQRTCARYPGCTPAPPVQLSKERPRQELRLNQGKLHLITRNERLEGFSEPRGRKGRRHN